MRRERILLGLAFLPGLLLMGRTPISMYFLRRALLYMVPLTALGIASVLYAVELTWKKAHWTVPWAVLLLAGAGGLYGRTSLCSMTEYSGLTGHFEAVAEEVNENE